MFTPTISSTCLVLPRGPVASATSPLISCGPPVSCSTIREVVLIPNRHWGGEGLLGCVFGYVLGTSLLS